MRKAKQSTYEGISFLSTIFIPSSFLDFNFTTHVNPELNEFLLYSKNVCAIIEEIVCKIIMGQMIWNTSERVFLLT